jgi:anaerobic selenocysteine-containing dehydrogenase
VRIRDGKIIAVEPDDTINPGLPREDGYIAEDLIDKHMIQVRPCAKGYAKARMIYDPNRVEYPMKRVGERGEAKFKRISWDEALDTIVAKLKLIKEKYGAQALAVYSGSIGTENIELAGFAQRFRGVYGTPNLLSVEGNCFRSRIMRATRSRSSSDTCWSRSRCTSRGSAAPSNGSGPSGGK